MAEGSMERARLLAHKMSPALAGEDTDDCALALALLTAHLGTKTANQSGDAGNRKDPPSALAPEAGQGERAF